MAIKGKIGIFMWASILVLFAIKNLRISPDFDCFHGGLPGAVSDKYIICKLLRGLAYTIMGGYG